MSNWQLTYATVEHRHENKSCLSCPKDQHKHLTSDICHCWAQTWRHKLFSMSQGSTWTTGIWHMSLLSTDMKTKVVLHVPRINMSNWQLTYAPWYHDKQSLLCITMCWAAQKLIDMRTLFSILGYFSYILSHLSVHVSQYYSTIIYTIVLTSWRAIPCTLSPLHLVCLIL